MLYPDPIKSAGGLQNTTADGLIMMLADFVRMERKRSVDWMCIGIEKIAETEADAQYVFVADVYEPDPRFRSRMMVIGQNRGVLRVAKVTGDVTLVEPMPEDDGEQRFRRAAAKVRKHWMAGDLPEKTIFACG